MRKLFLSQRGAVCARIACAFGLLSLTALSARADEATILAQFHPYRHGTPRIPGLEPGVTLTQEHAHLAREVLPAEVLHLLAEGEFPITVQETTDLPPRQAYLEATLRHALGVSLNGSTPENYRAGAPFPVLDPADPQAGVKLAWNLRYRDLGETFEMRPSPRHMNGSGGVEHSNKGHMRVRFGMYRPNPEDNDPQWQEQGVLLKNSFELLAPSDQEGIMNIRIIYDDDRRATEQWRYSPQNRRTRKDYLNHVAPIGGYYEMLQEEQPPFFFQGYLHNYEWQFLGARLMLVPGFLKTTELRYGGRNEWYPQVPWELRYVLLLECTPKHSHPLGKRVFVLDQQTYTPLLVLTYDHEGKFMRLVIPAHAHPDFHPGSNGSGLPVLVGASWVNYARNCATLFDAGDTMVYNLPIAAQRFELMEILRKGK